MEHLPKRSIEHLPKKEVGHLPKRKVEYLSLYEDAHLPSLRPATKKKRRKCPQYLVTALEVLGTGLFIGGAVLLPLLMAPIVR